MKPQRLRAIPAVEKVLVALGELALPRPAMVAIVRRELATLRQEKAIPDVAAIVARIRVALDRLGRSRLQPVINGTGILAHTNLGRAPLGADAVAALTTIAAGYNNLEYDLESGERGGRARYLEHNLALLCGAEAATVVNNCAAALVLMLRHLAAPPRPEVIISRGELIQIGGGFRIAEILAASGATLREVGATNRTTVEDYARAIHQETALILKVHRSNFFMDGFVASPDPAALAALARKHRRPLVEDLGSGAVVATETQAPIEHERTPVEALKQGVDLVCFSGDKLLGGPQAGIIAGKARQVRALKRHPLFRALRCDKLIFAALEATVDGYLNHRPGAPGPNAMLDMLRTPLESLHARAERLVAGLTGLPLDAHIGDGHGQVGGGTLPRSRIPSVTVELAPTTMNLQQFAARLRAGTPPVIGTLAGNRFRLDLRTVFPHQDATVMRVVRQVLTAPDQGGR